MNWIDAQGGPTLEPAVQARLLPDWGAYQRFRAQLALALDPRFFTIDYLDRLVLDDAAMVWVEGDAIMLTELRQYPGGARVIHGLVAAGNLQTIVESLIPMAENWARDNGCTFAEIESREGWARAVKGIGYEPHQITLRKAL